MELNAIFFTIAAILQWQKFRYKSWTQIVIKTTASYQPLLVTISKNFIKIDRQLFELSC